MSFMVLIGLKTAHLPLIHEKILNLSNKYPNQKYNVMPSNFKNADYVLVCFADTMDQAHKIGMALVKRELGIPGLLYEVKAKA